MRTFEDKLRSMTGKEVLKAMIDGLENPETTLDFWSFGDVREGVCYGCAATNTICKIGGVSGDEYVPQRDSMWEISGPIECLNSKVKTVDQFEEAIDFLRQADVGLYNNKVLEMDYANLILPFPEKPLPHLWDESYKADLHFYKEYYEAI